MGTPAQPGSPGIRLRLQPRHARISTPLPLRKQTLPGPGPNLAGSGSAKSKRRETEGRRTRRAAPTRPFLTRCRHSYSVLERSPCTQPKPPPASVTEFPLQTHRAWALLRDPRQQSPTTVTEINLSLSILALNLKGEGLLECRLS